MEEDVKEMEEDEEETDFELEDMDEEEDTEEEDENEQEGAAVVAGLELPAERFGPMFWMQVASFHCEIVERD